MITRYDFMKNSTTQSETDGTYYPDPLTFDTKRLRFNGYPHKYYLTQNDIERIDILMGNLYGTQKYKDLILDVNRIDWIWNKSVQDLIIVPAKEDLDTYIEENIV